jgi:two-component system chemotaxis response regulator CheB
MNNKIKVMVIDDQAIVREILDNGLSADPQIEVVARAPDPFIARDKILRFKPDVLTLDVEMPRMNGVEFLKKLMPQYPLPVIMVSSLTKRGKLITLEALESGAVDFVAKPDGAEGGLDNMLTELRYKIKIAAKTDVSKWLKIKNNKKYLPTKSDVNYYKKQIKNTTFLNECKTKIIAIGASTGGTTAINEIVKRLPENVPGIVIVQHMPAGFTDLFAKRLNQDITLDVKEAESGDMIVPGRILIAPGDLHMAVKRERGYFKTNIFSYEKVSGHRPSVDVLFDSIAECGAADIAIGVILTGMGKDGANGLLKIRQNGSLTIGQDETSSIVYGMPKVAKDIGAVETEVPLQLIAEKILQILR